MKVSWSYHQVLCPVLAVPLSSTFLTPRKSTCAMCVFNTNSEFTSNMRIFTYGQPRFAQGSNRPNCFDGAIYRTGNSTYARFVQETAGIDNIFRGMSKHDMMLWFSNVW